MFIEKEWSMLEKEMQTILTKELESYSKRVRKTFERWARNKFPKMQLATCVFEPGESLGFIFICGDLKFESEEKLKEWKLSSEVQSYLNKKSMLAFCQSATQIDFIHGKNNSFLVVEFNGEIADEPAEPTSADQEVPETLPEQSE